MKIARTVRYGITAIEHLKPSRLDTTFHMATVHESLFCL